MKTVFINEVIFLQQRYRICRSKKLLFRLGKIDIQLIDGIERTKQLNNLDVAWNLKIVFFSGYSVFKFNNNGIHCLFLHCKSFAYASIRIGMNNELIFVCQCENITKVERIPLAGLQAVAIEFGAVFTVEIFYIIGVITSRGYAGDLAVTATDTCVV